MRARSEAAPVLLSLAALAGCDKVYFARIDLGPSSGTQIAVEPLTPAEHDRAVAAFRIVAGDLGLHCEGTKDPIITDSYALPPYQLSACRATNQYTEVQLADSPNHVAVEIHQIGGLSEPPFFHACRNRISERMRATLPAQRVTVRYPYHWGSRDDAGR